MSQKIALNRTYTIEELEALITEAKKSKTTAKYPNGAEVFEPEIGTQYWFWSVGLDEWDSTHTSDLIDLSLLKQQRVFLSKEARDKALVVEKRHWELIQKVHEINAENDWAVDWSDLEQQKYIVGYDCVDCQFEYDFYSNIQTCTTHMCEKAMEWLLKQSESDKKAFLKIYN